LTMRWCLLMLLALVACNNKDLQYDKAYLDVDSLLNQQLSALLRERPQLQKAAKISGITDTVRLRPDSIGWIKELEIFRQLDAINKPTFKDAYRVEEMKDTRSNLRVRQLTSQKPSLIPVISFYYLDNLQQLRKIEARFEEDNALYASYRQLEMSFDMVNQQPTLSSYSVVGAQKMALADTVYFNVAANIIR
jgi:hypothetical protein